MKRTQASSQSHRRVSRGNPAHIRSLSIFSPVRTSCFDLRGQGKSKPQVCGLLLLFGVAKACERLIAEEKKGDLAEVLVYKFKVNKQETLLAYRVQPDKKRPQEVGS